jgi:mono/diheme cytochrome c family protein
MPLGVLLLASCALVPASSRKQREQGAELFASSGCQHCHTIGSVGGHRGPNLSGVGRIKSKTAIRRQIVGGSDIMPPFGDVLEPAEIDDLVAFLHSCRSKHCAENLSPIWPLSCQTRAQQSRQAP